MEELFEELFTASAEQWTEAFKRNERFPTNVFEIESNAAPVYEHNGRKYPMDLIPYVKAYDVSALIAARIGALDHVALDVLTVIQSPSLAGNAHYYFGFIKPEIQVLNGIVTVYFKVTHAAHKN